MKTREEIIAAIAEEILHGMPCRPALANVLDSVIDEPLISNEDAATLLFGNDDAKFDARGRCEKAAEAVVLSWLRYSPRGKALVDQRIERDRDDDHAGERAAA